MSLDYKYTALQNTVVVRQKSFNFKDDAFRG